MFLFLSQWIKSICRRMTYHLLISTGAFILPIIFLLVSFTAFGLFVIDPEQAKIFMNKFSIHQFIDLHKYRVVCAVLLSSNKRGSLIVLSYFPPPRLLISCQISPSLLILLLILHPVLIISHLHVYWFYNFCTPSSSLVIREMRVGW